MAIYQTRNCICAVQWDPEDKQSLENIKALVKDNPRLGWKVNDNILSNNVIICNCFGQQELCLHPYHYLVEGKRYATEIKLSEYYAAVEAYEAEVKAK